MSDKKQKYGELNIDHSIYKTNLSKKYINKKPYSPADITKVKSFISGTIVEVCVEVGQEVEEGHDLLILEAMKMKNRIKCPAQAKIRRIEVEAGQKVAKGDLLVVLI